MCLLQNEHMFDTIGVMELGYSSTANADLETLAAAVETVVETPVACLSDDELSDRVIALTVLSQRLAAARVEAVDQAEHVDIGRLSDQRNTANHVAAISNADPAPVRADALLGRWLRDFPIFKRAFEDGQLGFSHLNLLRKADNIRVHLQMVDDQECFVRWFTTVAFRDLPHVIDRWLLGADPDGAAPDEQANSGVCLTPLPGGSVRISGTLDPLQGRALLDAINHEEQKIRRQHASQDIVSSVRQRTLQALLNLTARGLARADGSMPLPRVNIVMSQKVYEETAKWLEDEANPFPEVDPSGQDIDRKCQMMDGTPIHPLYGFAAAAIGVMRRIVYSAQGRPVNVSKNARQIPKWMAEAQLITTNGKCSNPVCDSPFHWLHADHVTPYSHTKDTSINNTRPVCEPDNLWRGNDVTRGLWDTHPDG